MGYQGEDGSPTRANSRRQPTWQSSSGPGPAAHGNGYDPYAPDDSYADYDEYDQPAGYDQQAGDDGYGDDGFGQDGDYGYRQGDGYNGPAGYPAQQGGRGDTGGRPYSGSHGGSGAYPAQQGGYGGSGGYPAQPGGARASGAFRAQPGGAGNSGAFPAQPGGARGSGAFPAQPGGARNSGAFPARPGGARNSGAFSAQPGGARGSGSYPAQPGGHGGTGGYPALGSGAGADDVPGRYAGNDWYGGRPAGASGSGSGFADTGTYHLDRRAIEGYATGPHPAAGEAADPPGMVHTGQQERYDPGQYDAYSGHDNYGPPQAYDQGGYGQGYDEPEDYADPYQDRYGDDGAAPPAGAGGKPGRIRNSPGGRGGGKRRLLLAGIAVVVLGIAAAAASVFVLRPKPSPADSQSTGPLPSPGSTSAATAACVKQFGEYCHIELRTDDPAPLTLNELFPPAFANETDHSSFTRATTKLDTTCSNAVIGQDLIQALQQGKCTQMLRASYFSGDNKMMGTIAVANLSTTNEAHHAGKLVGTSDFIDPLSTTKGVTSKLGKGTGIVEAEYKGHYLIMIWAEFTSTNAPANSAQDQQLQQFGNDLIAGTANISLSQRMLYGHPATAAAG